LKNAGLGKKHLLSCARLVVGCVTTLLAQHPLSISQLG